MKKKSGGNNNSKVFPLIGILLFVGLLAYWIINRQGIRESKISGNISSGSGCGEIIQASPMPTRYDLNNPYSHKVIKDGIYVDYVQGFCFKFNSSDFVSIDGWLTSPKSIITNNEGEKAFDFQRPNLTLSANKTPFIDDENNKLKIEAINAQDGAKVRYENLVKMSEKSASDFKRATFYFGSKPRDFYKRVGYQTLWYLPQKSTILELSLYAHPDYEKDVKAYESSYLNIIESIEFF